MAGMSQSIALLIVPCVLAEVLRELCFKIGARHASAAQAGYALAIAQQPVVWLGIGCWVAELVLWLLVLQVLPLGVAFPLMALTYAAVPLAGVVLLGERLNGSQLAGVVLVAIGVACVGLSGTG
jgi:drug/metabolite transporter (DMT)-like permease